MPENGEGEGDDDAIGDWGAELRANGLGRLESCIAILVYSIVIVEESVWERRSVTAR